MIFNEVIYTFVSPAIGTPSAFFNNGFLPVYRIFYLLMIVYIKIVISLFKNITFYTKK